MRRRGESIIEVTVMLFVVMISVMIALNLITQSTTTTVSNRNYLIADNLALEGTEAIYNLIASNILRHGVPNIDQCWLVYPTTANGSTFTAQDCPAQRILDPNVLPVLNTYLMRNYSDPPDLHWELYRSSRNLAALDLERWGEARMAPYQLAVEPLKVGSNRTNYFYTNDLVQGEMSGFFRSIRLELIPSQFGEEVEVTSTVEWRESGRVQSLSKTTVLSNTNFVQ